MAAIKIVGEQTSFLNIIARSLARAGHQVQSLKPDAGGISVVAAGPPDLVLLDLYSEGIDGYELLLKLKQKNEDLPVLIYAIKNMDSLYSLMQCIQKALLERRPDQRSGQACLEAEGGLPAPEMKRPSDIQAPGAPLAQPA